MEARKRPQVTDSQAKVLIAVLAGGRLVVYSGKPGRRPFSLVSLGAANLGCLTTFRVKTPTVRALIRRGLVRASSDRPRKPMKPSATERYILTSEGRGTAKRLLQPRDKG